MYYTDPRTGYYDITKPVNPVQVSPGFAAKLIEATKAGLSPSQPTTIYVEPTPITTSSFAGGIQTKTSTLSTGVNLGLNLVLNPMNYPNSGLLSSTPTTKPTTSELSTGVKLGLNIVLNPKSLFSTPEIKSKIGSFVTGVSDVLFTQFKAPEFWTQGLNKPIVVTPSKEGGYAQSKEFGIMKDYYASLVGTTTLAAERRELITQHPWLAIPLGFASAGDRLMGAEKGLGGWTAMTVGYYKEREWQEKNWVYNPKTKYPEETQFGYMPELIREDIKAGKNPLNAPLINWYQQPHTIGSYTIPGTPKAVADLYTSGIIVQSGAVKLGEGLELAALGTNLILSDAISTVVPSATTVASTARGVAVMKGITYGAYALVSGVQGYGYYTAAKSQGKTFEESVYSGLRGGAHGFSEALGFTIGFSEFQMSPIQVRHYHPTEYTDVGVLSVGKYPVITETGYPGGARFYAGFPAEKVYYDVFPLATHDVEIIGNIASIKYPSGIQQIELSDKDLIYLGEGKVVTGGAWGNVQSNLFYNVDKTVFDKMSKLVNKPSYDIYTKTLLEPISKTKPSETIPEVNPLKSGGVQQLSEEQQSVIVAKESYQGGTSYTQSTFTKVFGRALNRWEIDPGRLQELFGGISGEAHGLLKGNPWRPEATPTSDIDKTIFGSQKAEAIRTVQDLTAVGGTRVSAQEGQVSISAAQKVYDIHGYDATETLQGSPWGLTVRPPTPATIAGTGAPTSISQATQEALNQAEGVYRVGGDIFTGTPVFSPPSEKPLKDIATFLWETENLLGVSPTAPLKTALVAEYGPGILTPPIPAEVTPIHAVSSIQTIASILSPLTTVPSLSSLSFSLRPSPSPPSPSPPSPSPSIFSISPPSPSPISPSPPSPSVSIFSISPPSPSPISPSPPSPSPPSPSPVSPRGEIGFPLIPIVPIFPTFAGGGGFFKKRRIRKIREYAYTPSYSAMALGSAFNIFGIKTRGIGRVFGKQPKGIETMFRVRPIPRGWTWAKLKLEEM